MTMFNREHGRFMLSFTLTYSALSFFVRSRRMFAAWQLAGRYAAIAGVPVANCESSPAEQSRRCRNDRGPSAAAA